MGESGCQPLKKIMKKKSISKVKSKMKADKPEVTYKSIHLCLEIKRRERKKLKKMNKKEEEEQRENITLFFIFSPLSSSCFSSISIHHFLFYVAYHLQARDCNQG
jgi:uncharacterized membrane protein (DUF106 family)